MLMITSAQHNGSFTATGLPHILHDSQGEVHIFDLPTGRKRIELVPRQPGEFLPRRDCETGYPLELIAQVLSVIGFNWLCDSIARDEDSGGVQKSLEAAVFSFVPKEKFRGRRLMDFGCGSGASTMILGRLLPQTEIVGVELEAKLLALAEARARYHQLSNVRFRASPCGTALPEGLDEFDFIIFSAVFEHLLPRERELLMPRIWARLAPGGVLFINQTPHRYFPIDMHSTGLPLINYFPDRLAHWAAVHFARHSSRINRSPYWEDHLRGGIRGGTERQILRYLCRQSAVEPILLQPAVDGLQDRVDLWFHDLDPAHYRKSKRALKVALKLIYQLFGTVLSPNLTLAVQKPAS
jgi:SAM-dependent methyltransferase